MDASWIDPGKSSQQQTYKRRFFQWVIKWFYAASSEDTQCQPDVPLLMTLLQAIGFRLRAFKQSAVLPNADGSRAGSHTMTVSIECGDSGMAANMELDNVKCPCFSPKEVEDASIRGVNGTGPTNASTIVGANEIEASDNNLPLSVDKDTEKIIGDVVRYLFKIIGDKNVPDVNQNSKSRSNLNLSLTGGSADSESRDAQTARRESQNFGRSLTQPEIVLNATDLVTRRKPLIKELKSSWGETFDTAALPEIVTTPVFNFSELSGSLDSVSLQSEQNTANLATHVIQAHKSLEKALEIISARKSPTLEQTFLKATAKRPPRLTVRDSARSGSRNANGSLKISPNSTQSLPVSSGLMSSRGRTALSLPKSALTTSASKRSITRRSVSSTATSVAAPPDGAGCKNSQPTASTASKIPGRRKTFHSASPMKLAAVGGKNGDAFANKATASKDRVNASGACQPAIPKMSAASNQSSTIPTLKVMPLKALGQKGTKETARRSLANPRFGFGTKKT